MLKIVLFVLGNSFYVRINVKQFKLECLDWEAVIGRMLHEGYISA